MIGMNDGAAQGLPGEPRANMRGAEKRRFRLFVQAPAAEAFGARRADILSLRGLDAAKREILGWPGYRPTPLRGFNALARCSGLGMIFYKDEASRFGLGSFKALGGAYAVLRVLRKHGGAASAVTVTCATDGNHGRSVAWGARTFGCRCVIYVHAAVSDGRCRAIEAYGAEVRRVMGTYDDAVRQAAADAAAQGWFVVSDTSYDGYVDVPRDVMQGYALMVEEALAQLPPGVLPTHVFVQGGVGGLAAAVCAYLWERLEGLRPRFVVVEPAAADCLYLSALAGHPVAAEGNLDTIMAGLACGEVSLLAWEILSAGADGFMTIDDAAAAGLMRRLADDGVVAGESAVAGLAGCLLVAADSEARGRLGLDARSVVLVFGTEGATDPEVYAGIVGRRADEVDAGWLG